MIEWANPWLLLLLPLPIFIFLLLPKARSTAGVALKIPFFKALQRIQGNTSHSLQLRWRQSIPAILIWVLLIIASAGPQSIGDAIELPRSGRDLILAVDLSGSMQIRDMEIGGQLVDRLTAVKAVAKQFIAERQGDRLGLILFGSKAYLQTPLTFDLKTVQTMLDDATIGLAGQETAIGDAVGLAIKRLQNADDKSRVIILLTDGNNNSGTLTPIQAARIAAQANTKIYTIGIGSDHVTVPSAFGRTMVVPAADLDTATLEEMAKLTGGEFFRAKDTQTLAAAYAKLDALEPTESDKEVLRPIEPLYPWPLAAALILILVLSYLKTQNRSSDRHAPQEPGRRV